MSTRPAVVRQSDLTRVLRAWRAAGHPEPRVEIRTDGTMVILPSGAEPKDESPLEAWRRQNGSR